jgi:hypothetical protein
MPQATLPAPQLLPQGAFVVQFHNATVFEAGQVGGRVEHVVSGQATTFQSLEALLTFMARVLQEGRANPSEQTIENRAADTRGPEDRPQS